MKIITRTGYGSKLQTELLLGLPTKFLESSTLNEAFQVQPGVLPESGIPVSLSFFCIGNGGHRNETGADGFPLTSPIQHRPTDAGQFKPLPFVVRELTADLDQATRAKYCLRTIRQYNGRNYVVYWGKRFSKDGVVPTIYYNKVIDGVVTPSVFQPDNTNLHPPQPVLPNTGTTVTDADYLSVNAILGLDLNANDVAEILNACRIIYNDERYAVISEIALGAGAKKLVEGPGPGASKIQYEEYVQSSVVTHMTGHYPVGFTNLGFNLKVNLGATEPMFAPSPITSGG